MKSLIIIACITLSFKEFDAENEELNNKIYSSIVNIGKQDNEKGYVYIWYGDFHTSLGIYCAFESDGSLYNL